MFSGRFFSLFLALFVLFFSCITSDYAIAGVMDNIRHFLFNATPEAIAINPETNTAVVAMDRKINLLNKDIAAVVDLNDGTVLSSIDVGRQPRGVAIDRALNLAVVSNSWDSTVSIIDLSLSQVMATISVDR